MVTPEFSVHLAPLNKVNVVRVRPVPREDERILHNVGVHRRAPNPADICSQYQENNVGFHVDDQAAMFDDKRHEDVQLGHAK
jgi:hypothetical protein